MKGILNLLALIVFSTLVAGCASSIVNGEYIRTSTIEIPSKPDNSPIEVYLSDKKPNKTFKDIGRVHARSWLLEKGINELKKQARKLGADAVINIKYERRFSVDYLQDLYFIDGEAVVWK